MNKGIQQAEEARVSSGGEFDAPPHGRRHNSVMNDVQSGHLVVAFAHNEEQRVKELGELREEVPPAPVSHPQPFGAVSVHGLASQTVAS